MSTCAFVGPSLPPSLRPVGKNLFYRPMARRGDIEAAARDGFAQIALIDGAMIYEYPPSPREIASVLAAGVHVIGAASLGALRAVELEVLGMVGSGWVFRAFRDGITDRDDELICSYIEPLSLRLSFPLINIRYACAVLVARHVLTEDDASSLLNRLTLLHYLERTAGNLKNAVLAVGMDPKFVDLLLLSEFDIKQHDAYACLRGILGGSDG